MKRSIILISFAFTLIGCSYRSPECGVVTRKFMKMGNSIDKEIDFIVRIDSGDLYEYMPVSENYYRLVKLGDTINGTSYNIMVYGRYLYN